MRTASMDHDQYTELCSIMFVSLLIDEQHFVGKPKISSNRGLINIIA